MKKIKLSNSCPQNLLKQIELYINKGYHTNSNPTVLYNLSTKKVSYHQILYKK